MRVVTIVSLAASAVLGLGALFVAKIALPNASAAKSPLRVEAVGKPVVVASRPLKYGEKLDAGMLTVINVPANAIPEGSFATVAQALAAARKTARAGDRIVVFGSFHTVGEALAALAPAD